MRLRRIQYPGKTLVVSSGDPRYQIFAAYFLSLWHRRFNAKPDLCAAGKTNALPLCEDISYKIQLPGNFIKLWFFLLAHKYKTVVFLNPDPKADRSLRWACRLAGIKNRAGFAPLRSWTPLNHSLPYNAENHHFVHQLKIFFEHLSGEKVADWQMPRPPESADSPAGGSPQGLIAIDLADAATEHLTSQLQKLLNLITRSEYCTLVIRSSRGTTGAALTEIRNYAKGLSAYMTERAIENTQLVLDPPVEKLLPLAAAALWVTGTDAELLNLAAFSSVPSLSLFGPLNERVWQPFSTRARALTGEFSCRPCTPFPGEVVCKNPNAWQCMRDLSGELWAATLSAQMRRAK
jgi:ADP-heptose:LPS heptosyltransferase